MKTRKPAPLWSQIKWPYNPAAPYCDWECHKRQIGKGRFGIILHPGQWPSEGWSYVASFGADSERSHSGFLKGFVSLASAKAEIERLLAAGRFD
jgi:hypothetical protein